MAYIYPVNCIELGRCSPQERRLAERYVHILDTVLHLITREDRRLLKTVNPMQVGQRLLDVCLVPFRSYTVGRTLLWNYVDDSIEPLVIRIS